MSAQHEEDYGNRLPEAGGVAWTDFYITKAGSKMFGAKVSLTARATNPTQALHDLMSALKVAHEEYGLSSVSPHLAGLAPDAPQNKATSSPAQPTPKQTPQPAAPRIQDNDGQVISAQTKTMKVETMHKSLTENGKPYIKIKGAPFTQYGVKAWPEAVSEFMDVDAMEIGVEYQPPAGMRNAIVELTDKGNPRKVLRFTN